MALTLRSGECQKFLPDLLKPENRKTRSHARDAREGSRAPRRPSPGRSGGTSHNLFVQKENDMTFRPLHDRILVRRVEADEKTAGGIIIPDTAKEKPQEGEVIAVGPGGRDEAGKLVPLDVKVGDRILFGKWSGTEIKLDGEDLLIMKESDVMGVIENAATLKKAA
jgi:chaperonin GroES